MFHSVVSLCVFLSLLLYVLIISSLQNFFFVMILFIIFSMFLSSCVKFFIVVMALVFIMQQLSEICVSVLVREFLLNVFFVIYYYSSYFQNFMIFSFLNLAHFFHIFIIHFLLSFFKITVKHSLLFSLLHFFFWPLAVFVYKQST